MNPPQTSSEPVEKREYARERALLTATVWAETVGGVAPQGEQASLTRPCRATVKDLSVSGLYFIAAPAYPVGATVAIQLTLGPRTYRVEGVIQRRVREPGERASLLGAKKAGGTPSRLGRAKKASAAPLHGCGVRFLHSDEVIQAMPAIRHFVQMNGPES